MLDSLFLSFCGEKSSQKAHSKERKGKERKGEEGKKVTKG
jgi:hypothetical protein